MRLINTHNLQPTEFPGEVNVRYAILSHRRDAEHNEISYKDLRKRVKGGTPGYNKYATSVALLVKMVSTGHGLTLVVQEVEH